MRLFAACFPPKDALDKILVVQTKLRSHLNSNASWVSRDRMHITLRFYGDDANIASCEKWIDQAVRGVRAFSIRIARIGGFPNLSQARTLFLEPDECHELQLLGNRLADDPSKSWHPHLTLARLRSPAKVSPLSFDPIEFPITEVLLVHSLLLKAHSRYECVRSWSLQ